jgi:radical SAM protein with 4Fe4S-binding SPASM domain
MSLMAQLNAKALALGVPISAHLDITYRCNERCEHCYLEHDDKGEMTTAEIFDILGQLADAGVFFLVISGGEPLLRRDFFQILERARSLLFNVKLKTNAVLIHEEEARRLRELGVEQIQISVYSHRPEVHDGITKLPGSLKKTLRAIEFLRSQGLKVTIANVLMRQNLFDVTETQRLAAEIGVGYTLDPTITPMMNGDTSILDMRAPRAAIRKAFRDPALVGNVEEFCAPPAAADAGALDALPCSAGHTACYISPYADVYPCVQFPLPSGNLRRQRFIDIWKNSSELNEVRSITARDLPTCSSCTHVASCTRCPGLAFMEGSMRGPSTADCEKAFVRTGIPSANMVVRAAGGTRRPSLPGLVQIRLATG